MHGVGGGSAFPLLTRFVFGRQVVCGDANDTTTCIRFMDACFPSLKTVLLTFLLYGHVERLGQEFKLVATNQLACALVAPRVVT